MLKKSFKWLVVISLITFVYLKLVLRGSNKFTVYHYHGIWLPSSTSNIKFVLYPDIPRILDDWAQNYCEMNKKDYLSLLHDQEYRYVIKKDTSADKISVTIHESEYSKIPDSLINKFPASYKCKSSTGDFLVIGGELIDSNTVRVMLYTDWN